MKSVTSFIVAFIMLGCMLNSEKWYQALLFGTFSGIMYAEGHVQLKKEY